MNGEIKQKQKILVADDSEMNRDILSDMLGDEYEIIEAENGFGAMEILEREGQDISLVLLDIVMPGMDGFGVLDRMNASSMIDDIPVIMITSENSLEQRIRAFDLGVTDFINRPYDSSIVRRRVVNTIMLYAKQKELIDLVAEQLHAKEKQSRMMIDILSHIVEFRNGESGKHVSNVHILTETLLKKMAEKNKQYGLSPVDISLISTASSLHDIGKIAIPEEILNKPGRLTDEEFEVMKTHSLIGAEMLSALPQHQDEPLVKAAYEICRWHHERYDGRGYPDGLSGENIPISAQTVALADVYDALTSERVYKSAIPHKEAIQMIVDGKCGAFNPQLIECLKDVEGELQKKLEDTSLIYTGRNDIKSAVREMVKNRGLDHGVKN